MNKTRYTTLMVLFTTSFLFLGCAEKGILTTPPVGSTIGTITTDFSNIVLKSHIPKTISDGGAGTLTTEYQKFTMGDSDASIIYELWESNTTYRLFKTSLIELDSDPMTFKLGVSGNGSKILSDTVNNDTSIIDYASGAVQTIGVGVGFLGSSTITDTGNLVAFWLRNDLTGGNPALINQLFTLTTDGSDIYNQITSFATDNEFGYVTISGDGSKIFFGSTFDVLGDGSNSDGSWEIYSIDINGTNLHQHTNLDSGNIQKINVSSDGGVISTVISGRNGSTMDELHTIDAATDTLTFINNSVGIDHYDLSADGTTIAYVRPDNSTGNTVISLINPDGTSKRDVLVVVGDINRLHINTDGTQITFESAIDFGKGVTLDENPIQIYTLTVI